MADNDDSYGFIGCLGWVLFVVVVVLVLGYLFVISGLRFDP